MKLKSGKIAKKKKEQQNCPSCDSYKTNYDGFRWHCLSCGITFTV